MSTLSTYVRAWSTSAHAVRELCDGLGADDWARPTDCPGWTVHDVLAHLAAIESELATSGGGPGGGADSGAGPSTGRRTVITPDHTEPGVRARRTHSPERLLTELTEAVTVRERRLRDLPSDPTAPAHTPGGVDWDWGTLLRNRAIDLWVHEQDLRRAVGAPGGFDTGGAQVVVDTFAGAMGFVLGKKVAPPAGSTVVWDVSGPIPFVLPLGVQEDGRARPLDDVPVDATATLRMGTEAFTVLAAGRHPRCGISVELAGDPRLCGRVLASMAVTP